MKQAKNMKSALTKFEKSKKYQLEEAISMIKNIKFSNFDESVDVAINLNVDPRHAEENIRITTALPHGTGKKVSVLVIASGVKEKVEILILPLPVPPRPILGASWGIGDGARLRSRFWVR